MGCSLLIAACCHCNLQVLELLGTVGTSLWAGWAPPPGEPDTQAAAGSRFNHQQALLLARVVSTLAAAEWPGAAQQCRLSAADFESAEAAEGAVLRLIDVASALEQLQAVVAVLQQALQGAYLEAETAPGEAGDVQAQAAPHPLHRAWSACLHALIRQRQLAPVLSAVDEWRSQQQHQQGDSPGRCLLARQEARSLAQAAEAALGAAAASVLAALLPYPPLRKACTEQLVEAVSSSGAGAADLAALPGMGPLLVTLAAEEAQPLLPQLASSRPPTFKQLCTALLQQEDAVMWADLGAGLTLRAAACASLVAQLVAARHYTAAGWLAMQFTGLHPLLRVLDNSGRAARQLLWSCSSARPAGAGAASAALPTQLPAALGLAHVADGLVRGLPGRCDAALRQLDSDQQ